MKAKMTAMALYLALAIGLTATAGLARAEEAKLPSPAAFLTAIAEAGKPGPEHQKLTPFIGDWALTVKLWTDPNQPPVEASGTVQSKWIMGGRFVQQNVKTECNGKSFEGLGLLGYHPGEKKFTSVRACGLCGTVSHALTTLDASAKTFTCSTEECCPLTGQKVAGRDEVIIESDDKIITNVYKTVGGREVKVMQMVSTRK